MELNEFSKEKTVGTEIVPSYDLLYITRAYNQKEISFDEWLVLSREWAEKIIEQYEGRVA
jgi:hypothetical protein